MTAPPRPGRSWRIDYNRAGRQPASTVVEKTARPSPLLNDLHGNQPRADMTAPHEPTRPGDRDAFLARLHAARAAYPLPFRLRETAEAFAHAVLALLFPH